MNGDSQRFGRTRKNLNRIAQRRTKTVQKRDSNSRHLNARRPQTVKRTQRVPNNRRGRQNGVTSFGTNYRPHLTYKHQGDILHVNLERMNKLSKDIPVRKNFEYEGYFPDIKPPQASIGRSDFGDCLIIAGTESFLPVTINTTALGDDATQVGSIITNLAINPTLLSSTRLKKLSENYEKWYPRKLILEYVPQGSALDSGALISIPVMDPADTFVGSTGNDAIRRALAYEKSFAFNIYDKPQILLPPAELDEPYFVIPGSDARLEISHSWFLMAQTQYEPRNVSEETRVLGWFKLHYVIEFYEPRIPIIEDPLTHNISIQGGAIATYFGAERAVGDEMVGSVSLTFPSTPCNFLTVRLETAWQGGVVTPNTTIVVSDSVREFSLLTGVTLYARVTHDFTPIIRFFSTINDMFEQNNPLTWAIDGSAFTEHTVLAVATAMWN